MFTRRLGKFITSGEKKGQQAYVKVTNDELGFDKDNPLLVEQDKFEYPQFGPQPEVEVTRNEDGTIKAEVEKPLTEDQAQEGVKEFVASCGSAVRALEIINDATRDAALYEGKSHIRLADKGQNVDDVVAVGLKKSREFSWKEIARVTVKEFKATMDDIATNLEALSAEEIAAKVKALLGRK